MKLFNDEATGKPVEADMLEPADMHQHVRQADLLELVVPMVAARFGKAIIMPNTVPPITTHEMALHYLAEICRVRDESGNKNFHPLMTLYLTDTLDPKEVDASLRHKVAYGIKYYPRGLTTNSDSGVANPSALWTTGTKPYECLRVLAEHGGVLLLHAADGFDKDGVELDPYEQERHFVTYTLPEVIRAHPRLKISVEHLSTKWGVEFMIANGGERLGCSLTAHHLLLDRRDVFRGGFHPHRSWMPVIQPPEHKESIRVLAKANKPFVWLGSDSAPHPRSKKESACCASGVLMAHAGIELYAEAFEDMNALDDRFEQFASINGPTFYGLLPSDRRITLVREEWKPGPLFFGDPSGEAGVSEQLVPFRLGEPIRWKLAA